MIRLFNTHKIRKTEELSGKLWNFTPMEKGYQDKKCKVMIPGCLENLPGFGNYRGWAAYETEFEGGGNIRLEFKGVSHFAKIYVDDKNVAEHYGSYTPFAVCIKALEPGKHKLVVLVDNALREEYALDMPNDYMSYGGISRGVVMEMIPDLYIKYVHVTPLHKNAGNWIINIEVMCENLSDEEVEADLQIELAGAVYLQKGQHFSPGENLLQIKNMEIPNAETWAPENPILYMLEAKLYGNGKILDDWIDRTGFRTVEVNEKDILLNGKPLRIKGFCRHEDHPQYGCALPAQAIAYDLQMIRDLGANSVRTSHYPNDELFLDLCDEMGILVWEENHARGIEEVRMKNPYFEPQCEQVIREMITEHYNHPSIYIWGILNECGSETEYGRICYRAQYELIRSLDSSRPATSASCKFNADICQDLPDVCSWNIYPYWYDERSAEQMARDVLTWVRTEGNGAGKPFLVSEIGAGGIYAFRDMAHDIWSEDLQAEILGKQLTELLAYEDCVGMYIWQFCDVRVSRIDWAMRRPKSRNNKGVVDEYRRPKMAYQVVKDIFHQFSDYR